MGMFDFLEDVGLGFLLGGTPAEKAARLRSRVTQKYGDATVRQGALRTLGDLKHVDALPALLLRFTVNVEPASTDAQEKESVFADVVALDEAAVPAVVDFLRRNDGASSWAVKLLDTILPDEQSVALVAEELTRLGAEYTRDPEKKEVLLHYLADRQDPRIPPVLLPFLHDMSDDVKLAAIKAVAVHKVEAAREPLLQLLTAEDSSRRVQNTVIQALHDTGFTVQGYREKVEKALQEPWYLDKAGQVKKRG